MYQDFDDIVFEDRHKAYGAYAFRKHYEHTLTKALLIGVVAFLLVFLFFNINKTKPEKKTFHHEDMVQMDITNMLINFGDNRNGKGIEEPKKQESSPAPLEENKQKENTAEEAKPSNIISEKSIPENTVPTPTRSKNTVVTPKSSKVDKNTKSPNNNSIKTPSNSKTTGSVKKEDGVGDGRGNAAIGTLLAGRGSKGSGQGTGRGSGNTGDPFGGEGDGDSRIGVDRKLVGFIPGTMGRGGGQPTHDCKASGSITISYTVDKAGNITSATRSSGSSDPCLVSTSTKWVKQYVKAEKSSVSSKGTYKITF